MGSQYLIGASGSEEGGGTVNGLIAIMLAAEG